MSYELVTVQELAAELRLAPSTLYDWRSEGRGPESFRQGGRVVYKRAKVEAWQAEQERLTARGGVA